MRTVSIWAILVWWNVNYMCDMSLESAISHTFDVLREKTKIVLKFVKNPLFLIDDIINFSQNNDFLFLKMTSANESRRFMSRIFIPYVF